jgi:hypothetical protein
MTPKIFLAVPMYGALCPLFHQSLIKTLQAPPCSLVYTPLIGDSLVSRARNTLTALFLESDCTHLLFIDSDLIFSAEQIERMLSHKEPIVAGFYPKKQDGDLQWVCNAKLDGSNVDERGLQEVRYMGTGFLLVERGVFERMIGRYGEEISYHPDSNPEKTEWDFWSVGVHKPSGRYLSEDWFFCQRALDLGYKVFGDTRVILKHVGQAVYPLQSQQPALSAAPLEVVPDTSSAAA